MPHICVKSKVRIILFLRQLPGGIPRSLFVEIMFLKKKPINNPFGGLLGVRIIDSLPLMEVGKVDASMLLARDYWVGATVLLAEDDEVWSYTAGHFLKKSGFKVLSACDGKEALDIYDRHLDTIDVILSDMQMPRMDGLQLAQQNFHRFNLPFVMCTGVNDHRIALDILDFGVQDYVVKPSSEKHLVNVVKHALARCRLLGETPQQETFAGNLDKITVEPRMKNISHAEAWLHSRINALIESRSGKHFLNFVHEFLINAYEHGCLGITEQEKSDLIGNGEYESELARREQLGEKGEIEIRLAVLGRKVTVTINDNGPGFDFDKYLNMNSDDIASRISMPNGRGILMASRHCDEVSYDRGGSRVTLVKTFN